MTVNAIDKSQQKAARVAGLAFLVSFFAVVVSSFGVFFQVIVHDNALETAHRILANERLFRLATAGEILNCVALVVLIAASYVVLRPVNRNLAALAAVARLVEVFTWLLVVLNNFRALHVLADPVYARAFGSDQVPALAQVYLNGMDEYYVGLLFWTLALAIGSYLWFTSNYIPRSLAIFGLMSSVWCAFCTFVYYVFPGFADVVNLWWFDTPMVLYELALSVWLLVKGVSYGGGAYSVTNRSTAGQFVNS
jgi:hypothetical protein